MKRAVKQWRRSTYIGFIAHGLHNPLQRIQTRHRAIDLAPGMVAYYNTIDAQLNGLPRISGMLYSLNAEGPAPANSVPLVH